MTEPEHTETEDAPTEPPKKLAGFADPEIRKKAMEASFKTRYRKAHPEALLEFDLEELALAQSGDEEKFLPTKKMIRVLEVAVCGEAGESIRSWFRHLGMNRATWYLWTKIPGFSRWWDEAFKQGMEQYRSQWLSIGMRKMKKDFRYWNSVGEKIFGYAQKLEIKDTKSPEETALYQELVEIFRSQKSIRNAKEVNPVSGMVYTAEELQRSLEEDAPDNADA